MSLQAPPAVARPTVWRRPAAVLVLAGLLLPPPSCEPLVLPLCMCRDVGGGGGGKDPGGVLPMHRFLPVPKRIASDGNAFAQIIERRLPAAILYADDELVSVPARLARLHACAPAWSGH